MEQKNTSAKYVKRYLLQNRALRTILLFLMIKKEKYTTASEGGRGGASGAMAPPIFSSASPRNFKKRSLDLKVRLVDKV